MFDITKMDEKEAVLEDFKNVSEILPEFVRDCVASTRTDLRNLKGLNERQRLGIEAAMCNRYMAEGWRRWHPAKGWNVDNSGFFHLYSANTLMHANLHAVDPITRGMPKANHTLADRARYSQDAGKKRGELSLNFFDYPDLSDVYLVIACDYLFPEAGSLRVYKPMSADGSGRKRRVAYSFPILNDGGDGGRRGWAPGFDPTPETDIDILDGLIVEERLGL